MPAFHWHRCEECGRWWRHADNCRGNTAAHTCACGEECWVVAWPEEHGYEFTQEPPDSRPYQDCKADPRTWACGPASSASSTRSECRW
jgi:hypothetical protein